jgi:uncharacterized protein YjbK
MAMDQPQQINREIEIKLDLGSFTNYLKLVGFLGQIDREERQLNAFFDTADRRLAKAGWALRARAENSRGLVTIKSIATEIGAAFIRQEMEAEIGRDEALDILAGQRYLMTLPVLPVDYLKEKLGGLDVVVLVKFENIRQEKSFRIGDYHYILEIDKTEFSDSSVDYELEVELTDTSRLDVVMDSLKRMFDSLDIPFQRQTESKFARALQHAGIR